MAAIPTYTFQRGETISLALDATSGDVGLVSAITAWMRRAIGAAVPPESAEFTVTARAAAGDVPAGWDLVVDAAASAALPAGLYDADAAVTIAGGTSITSKVQINLTPSPSGELS